MKILASAHLSLLNKQKGASGFTLLVASPCTKSIASKSSFGWKSVKTLFTKQSCVKSVKTLLDKCTWNCWTRWDQISKFDLCNNSRPSLIAIHLRRRRILIIKILILINFYHPAWSGLILSHGPDPKSYPKHDPGLTDNPDLNPNIIINIIIYIIINIIS